MFTLYEIASPHSNEKKANQEAPLFSGQEEVYFFDASSELPASLVGGKAANLQKISHVHGIVIPPWAVFSVLMFQQFLEETNLFSIISELDSLCISPEENTLSIKILSDKIQTWISESPLSSSLSLKISKAYESLIAFVNKSDPIFAVRSSGVTEDCNFSSCAGLYDTFLNVRGVENIINAIKSVWSSSFKLSVIQERIRLGLKQTDCLMGVILQEQVDARASGTVSTLVLSNNYPGIQISGNYGIGESVVSGEVNVDEWILHPAKGYILEAIQGNKEFCHNLNSQGGTEKRILTNSKRKDFVLSRHELTNIFDQVKLIKEYYSCDVDVEYAFDQKGELIILQARPLVKVTLDYVCVDQAEELSAIGHGLYSVAGVATGRLVFVESLEQLESEIKLEPNDIVLAYVTTNVWSQYLVNIAGLITREGSPCSHPILLCRERQIPCVIGIADGFEQLITYSGEIVTIDGFNKCVYQGKVPIKKVSQSDLSRQFETVAVREWPELSTSLPHLLHNKMAVEYEGAYWRRTPTYPVVGFQQELNMLRFDIVPALLNKEGKIQISAKVIDDYACCELKPFSDYVALFEGFEIKDLEQFNENHQKCIQMFEDYSSRCIASKTDWENYINSYARLRAFIWLGDALRSYALRKVEEIGAQIELPAFYLEECAKEIQSKIPEMDVEMHQKLHELAFKFQEIPIYEHVEGLKDNHEEFYQEIETIGKKYRFEHKISLDKNLDLNFVYTQLKKEIEAVRKGKIFTTKKTPIPERIFLPEKNKLKRWLQTSIKNRILQSDSHHIDARAKEIARPQFLELGEVLVKKGLLNSSEEIFNCSLKTIEENITESK